MIGSVKWYNPQKGYGFASCEKGDVFIHRSRSKLDHTLRPGEEINFELEKGEKGLVAVNVIANQTREKNESVTRCA